jgi:phage shock protein A
VDDQEENLVEKNKVLQTQVDELTNKVVILEWEKTALKDEVETLKSDLTLIKGHQSGKIVVLDVDNEDNLKKVDQKVLQKEVTNYKNILNNGY